jgi:hypothetical protein
MPLILIFKIYHMNKLLWNEHNYLTLGPGGPDIPGIPAVP